MDDLRLRDIMTGLLLGGKTLEEAGFPNEWTYDPLMRGWEKEGYDSEQDGVKTKEKFWIPEKRLLEIKHRNRGN